MEKADAQVIEFPRRLRLVFLRFSSLFIRGMSKKMEGPKILATAKRRGPGVLLLWWRVLKF